MTPTPTATPQNTLLDLVKLMRPWAMRTTRKLRLGNDWDGGYVLPEQVLQCDAILSVGVGPDVSFDLVMAQRGARVLQFDHTVDGVPAHQQHANFTFEKKGWGRETLGPFLSFDDMMARFNAWQPRRAMFKFDVEGSEYELLEGVDADALRAFEVIACEIHDMDKLADPAFLALVDRALRKLNTHHVPVHLHANNYAAVVLVQGVPLPKVLELTFLRRDLDQFPHPSFEPIPGPLDRPNHPGLADICMNAF